jgi:O-antigen/teichoic acid export membrane protein
VTGPAPGTARLILLNTWYRTIADFLAKFASIALYIVMARQLGSSEFGVFAFGLSFVTLVTALADFGQDRVLTREVARSRAVIDKYFVNTIALKLVLAVPALAVAIAILTVTASAQTRNVAVLLGVAVVVEQLMATCFSTFQAYERLVYIPAALVTQRFLTAVVGIAALLAGSGVVAVSAIYLGGACVGFAIAIWLLLTRVVRPPLWISPRMWRGLMLAALPIGAAGVFSTVLFRADMAMLAAIGTAEDVGKYAAAYRLFETTLFLSWGVGAAVFPVYSRLTATTSPPIRQVFERSLKLAVALVLPLAVGALVLAHPFVDLLYGSHYEASADALVLLAPAIALYPFAYLSTYLLVAQNRQRVLAPIYAAIAIENIVLNFILLPVYSLYGAAFGTSLSELLVAVVLMVFVLRLLGRLNWLRMLGGPVLAAGLAGGAAALLIDQFWIAVVVMALVYLGTLLAFEQLVYPGDAAVLWRFVHRTKS